MRKRDLHPDLRFERHRVAAGIMLVVFAATLGGRYIAPVPMPAGVLWPPAGIGLAALLVYGYEMWPAVFAGMLGAGVVHSGADGVALSVASAATAEAYAGAWLVNRWACGAGALERTRCFVRFAIGGGLVAAAIGPSLGVPALALVGFSSRSLGSLLGWWLGDGVSTLVLTPALLLWAAPAHTEPVTRRPVEAVALTGALAAPWFSLFSGWVPAGLEHYPLEVLCVPGLVWAAYRFGPRVASLAVVGLTMIGVNGTAAGVGPFAFGAGIAGSVLAHAFIAVSAVTTLALATVTSERREAEARLRALARTDGLTGVANFRTLMDALESEVARAMRRGNTFAILFMDLDDLKVVNDTMGHLAGNRALIRVASALRSSSRSMDTPARLGGDEFCILLPDADETIARAIAARVQLTLAAPWSGPAVRASSGIAVYPRDGATAEDLLAAADAALYGAKTQRARSPHAARLVPARAGTQG